MSAGFSQQNAKPVEGSKAPRLQRYKKGIKQTKAKELPKFFV